MRCLKLYIVLIFKNCQNRFCLNSDKALQLIFDKQLIKSYYNFPHPQDGCDMLKNNSYKRQNGSYRISISEICNPTQHNQLTKLINII